MSQSFQSQMEENLYYAIQADDVTTLRRQLNNGVNVNTLFVGTVLSYGRHNRWSALHLCCEKGRYECAKELLEQGADPNSHDKWNLTPLAYAVQTQWHNLVELLLSHGAEVNNQDRKGRTPIHFCVEYTDEACVGESKGMSDSAVLIKKLMSYGADPNIGDTLGRTPLWVAASEDGHVDQIRALLDAKCDVNIPDVREQRTALQCSITHLQTHKDRMTYVRLLLEAGTDVNRRDARNHTAFMNVIWRTWSDGNYVSDEDMEICARILKCPYDVNSVRKKSTYIEYGGSALALAVERGACPLVDMLLEYGADPDVCDIHGTSPLLLSVFRNRMGCTARLISHNANMTLVGQIKVASEVQLVNAFQCACTLGNEDIAMLLVHSGYDLTNETYLWTNQNVPRYLLDNLELWAWLREFVMYPLSLVHLCRLKIRKMFGKRILLVKSLAIPTYVIGVILLNNIFAPWI